MNASAFESKRFPALIIFVSLVLTSSAIFILEAFFRQTSRELVESWHKSEAVNLQQGNILSSVAKLQRSIDGSGILMGAKTVDENGRVLMDFGKTENFPPALNQGELTESSSGLFRRAFSLRSGNITITLFTSAPILLFLSLALGAYLALIVGGFGLLLRRLLKERENYRLEMETREIRQKLDLSEGIAALSKQVAHDIRAPLFALEVALNGANMDAERKSLLEGAGARIKKIAEDLLHQARETNKDIPGISTFDIAAASRGIVSEKNGLSSSFQIYIEGPEVMAVQGDASAFERLLSNLLDNSIEALRPDVTPRIAVSIRIYGEKVALHIEDNGRGIPASVLPEVGKEGVSHGKKNGNGLGLFTAKAKMQEWGGRLDLISRENEGTQITLIFRHAGKPN